ncbi:hypothetical protein [Paramicrobacterium humi]|uniref:hypothetical protein n=1 Tax=Paramicrobacterium humi TaxID=640635 RepID=UPI0015A3C417
MLDNLTTGLPVDFAYAIFATSGLADVPSRIYDEDGIRKIDLLDVEFVERSLLIGCDCVASVLEDRWRHDDRPASVSLRLASAISSQNLVEPQMQMTFVASSVTSRSSWGTPSRPPSVQVRHQLAAWP